MWHSYQVHRQGTLVQHLSGIPANTCLVATCTCRGVIMLQPALDSFVRGLTLFFSRMLENSLAGSLGEANLSTMSQIVFKMLLCYDEFFSN